MKAELKSFWKRTVNRGVRNLFRALCLIVLFQLTSPASASDSAIDSIEYLFADKAIQMPSELTSEGWLPFDSSRSQLAPQTAKTLWIKIRLRHSKSAKSVSIGFDKIYTRFQFFKMNNLIESYGTTGGYAGLPPHVIDLPSADGQELYFMMVDSSHTCIGPVGRIQVGQRSDFILGYFRV